MSTNRSRRTNLDTAAVSRRLLALIQQVPSAALGALEAEAKNVYDESQQLVPIVTGELSLSGKVAVEPATPLDTKFTATVSYGSPTFGEYAPKVHENPASTGYKYLERPLNQAVNGLADRLARRIEAQLWHSE